jgi:hypothetical protein
MLDPNLVSGRVIYIQKELHKELHVMKRECQIDLHVDAIIELA